MKRNNKFWNLACDYVINAELREQGFPLPEDARVRADFAGMTPEQVYQALIDEFMNSNKR